MRNIERLTKHITKNGAENILIHVIPGTTKWLICQKIEPDKWIITLGDPMGNVFFNLGNVNNAQHLSLWIELTKYEIERKASKILIAQQYKQIIKNFLNNYNNQQTYKSYLKQYDNKKTIRKKIKKIKKNLIN